MPQLDLYSYSSVVCWLLVVFSLFYFISLREALPKLYKILLVRNTKLESLSLEINSFTKEMVLLNGLYTSMISDFFENFKELFRVLKTFSLKGSLDFFNFDSSNELELLLRLILFLKVDSATLVATLNLSKKLV